MLSPYLPSSPSYTSNEGDRVGLELAQLLQTQGRYAEALEHYAALGNDLGARIGRLRVLRQQHRHAEAETEGAALLAKLPNRLEVLLEAGRLALRREAYPLALQRFELAVAAAVGRPEPLEKMLEAQIALGRFATADALLDELIRTKPLAARWRATRARAAEARGDLSGALQQWQGVLEVGGHSLPARLAIGRLLTKLGRSRATALIYRDLVDTHPEAAEPVVALAELALRQSETTEALAWLERARALNPEDDRLNSKIARIYAEDGQTKEARRFARQFLAARSESPEAYLTVARIEELVGALPRAVRVLRTTLRSYPQSFTTALKLARLLEREGDTAAALAALESVRKLVPDCYGLELARIDLLLDRGEIAQAVLAIDILLVDHGGRRDLQKRLARVEVKRGQLGRARQRWAHITRFDPRVTGPPVSLHRLDRRPLVPQPGEVQLFTRLRNQLHRLRWFLDFYRAQGVGRFVIVDNGSDDGTREYLLGQEDVHLFLTTNSYAEYGGGMRWLNELLAQYGIGHWCLTVDVDEILAYPHAERLGLQALTRYLDAEGAEALFTFMLDMYPEGPITEAHCVPDEAPFAVCPLFDRGGYITRPNSNFPFRMVVGGPMARLLYAGRQDATYLHKVPLVRWRPDLRYTLSMHHLYPVRLAAETGVLLHFKFLGDLPAKAAGEAVRKEYGRGGRRYTALNSLFAQDPGLSLVCKLSERLRGTEQLARLGHLHSSPPLDAFAAQLAGEQLRGWTALGGDSERPWRFGRFFSRMTPASARRARRG